MGVRLITAPAIEPVTLAEAKADLRIDHDDDNALLERHIAEAREWVEQLLQIKLLFQTWELVIDKFPPSEIKLPFGPVNSIVSILYDDAGGLEQTVAPGTYTLDNINVDAWVIPGAGGWPSSFDGINAARVRFQAGVATAAELPGPIKQAIRVKVQESYDGDDKSGVVHRLLVRYYRMFA